MGMKEIVERINLATRAAGRPPESVRLIAVSKEQSDDRVTPILAAGQRVFGENRVQEALMRWGARRVAMPELDLHLIGPLQTNKARVAMGLFQSIHTLDRDRLAQTLARLADETGACPDLFVQVNTGDESQKAGCAVTDAPGLVGSARALGLPVVGLMCIPPAAGDPTPHFRLLAAMAADLGLPRLSMGMSGDFETAIACGATDVRVGSAIFGARA